MTENIHAREICKLCGGEMSLRWRKENAAGVFNIDQCARCGFNSVNPVPSEEFIIEYYANDGHASPDKVSKMVDVETVRMAERIRPNSTIDAARIVSTVKQHVFGGRVLDVGCGYGFFAKQAQDEGYSVDAIEIASTERGVAEKILGWAPKDLTFEAFPEAEQYDVIIMSQILEHARDPDLWLRKARRLLRVGGVLVVAVPNFGSVVSRILGIKDPFFTPPAHLNYFTSKSLSLALSNRSFKVIKSETVSRYPASTFIRRFGPVFGGYMSYLSKPVVSVVDRISMGAVLTVYSVAK